MTKTITGTNGTIWYKNTFSDMGHEWLNIKMIMAILKFGWSYDSFPPDIQQERQSGCWMEEK